MFYPFRQTSIRIYIMKRTFARARAHTKRGMDDKPLILPIEPRCWDWTRSFPYPFDVITAGTVAIQATAMAIISRDAAPRKSADEFSRSSALLPVRSFLLISFNFHCSLFAHGFANAWIFDDVVRVDWNRVTAESTFFPTLRVMELYAFENVKRV